MDGDNMVDLERAVETFLVREPVLTPEYIRERIAQFRVILPVSDDEAELLARRLEVRHDVTMTIGSVLTERGYRPWLESAKAGLDFYYWNRYRRLLEEKHLASQVLTTLNAETDRTLGLLQNPVLEGPWNRRGMVVGHVQSGKTANYIGLICKAADAGYRLIVVIAGVHNNLRNQTQKRIDEGLVGRDSARLLSQREEKYVGVGRIDPRRRPVTFTNSVRDFNKAMATGVGVPLQNLKEPAVFVIKKNASTLRHLLEWLREHNASRGNSSIDEPMLLIDDEADNASINVRYGQDEVSRINGQIRDLLLLFSRSCYVGYTATPFANIFIDPDTDDEMRGQDLFPRHFIVSLDPPSNYVGPERVFRDDSRSIIRHIEDNEILLPLRHTINFPLVGLPESLIKAVRTFIVGRSIRLLRGHGRQHCSMLVNASRFTGVQGEIRARIQILLEDIQASVRLHCALPTEEALRDPEMASLHEVWKEEFGSTAAWPAVQGLLLEAVSPIKVVEVNTRSHGTLNYDEYEATGLNVIAVGGFSLSRGLTLEGLMVSYFLRNSMMYDTLMQMGRWFGYRPEYEDLCRVWMLEEAEGWYTHIAEAIDMLREEFRTMAAAGATPEEFGLKVRAHPDTLIVTARNKMGSGETVVVRVGLGNQFVETYVLKGDENSVSANRNVARQLVSDLKGLGLSFDKAEPQGGGWLLRDVPVEAILTFLGSYSNHPLSLLTASGPLSHYIRERQDSELAVWDLFVPGIARSENTLVENLLGVAVNCQRREAGGRSDDTTIFVTNKQRVASRGVERIGLPNTLINEAELEYRKEKGTRDEERLNFPDRIYRARRPRPLFVLHFLNMLRDGKPMRANAMVAWSVSFPRTQLPEQRVEYVVTTTWLRENFRPDLEQEEEEEEGDDA